MRFLIPLLLGIVLLSGALSGSSERSAHPLSDQLSPRQIATAYTPDQIATAYDYSKLYDRNIDGTGQSVALIEIDSYAPSDIAAFDSSYDLPAPSITSRYVGGKRFSLETQGETTLDIEWLHALAPGAAIRIYYVKNSLSVAAGWRAIALGLRRAASDGAGVVSISLGACQPDRSMKPLDAAFAALFHRDISVFVSSGDNGDHPGPLGDCGSSIGVTYPGGDPYVASVGGTSLYLQRDDSILREIACPCSGGGRVRILFRRPWERAPTMPAGRQRWAPDVAFLADQGTGVNYLFRGEWVQTGGTSLGAPAWAAAWSLILQDASGSDKTVAPAVKLFYRIGNSAAYATDFHDITTGSNGTYHAGPGWDAVTGWGTPDVAQLAGTVISLSPLRQVRNPG